MRRTGQGGGGAGVWLGLKCSFLVGKMNILTISLQMVSLWNCIWRCKTFSAGFSHFVLLSQVGPLLFLFLTQNIIYSPFSIVGNYFLSISTLESNVI